MVRENPGLKDINLTKYFKRKKPKRNFFEMKFLPLVKNKLLIDLIKKMLDPDFNKRISARSALQHPFFHSSRSHKRHSLK